MKSYTNNKYTQNAFLRGKQKIEHLTKRRNVVLKIHRHCLLIVFRQGVDEKENQTRVAEKKVFVEFSAQHQK